LGETVIRRKPSVVRAERMEVGTASRMVEARRRAATGGAQRLQVRLDVWLEDEGKRKPAMMQLEPSIRVDCTDAAAVAWVREEFRRFGERLREYDGEGPGPRGAGKS
jgi:hypothetical protein